MAASYHPYAPDQDLCCNGVFRWLPEGHLSYFMNDVIDFNHIRVQLVQRHGSAIVLNISAMKSPQASGFGYAAGMRDNADLFSLRIPAKLNTDSGRT